MRIVALVKQVSTAQGTTLEMSPDCRRAVSHAVDLADHSDGTCTFITLGAPSTEDTLREALAWALERDVPADGVRILDPGYAGFDAHATARALALAVERLGPFDLVVIGPTTSAATDVTHLGHDLATQLGLPFVADEGWTPADRVVPTVLSTSDQLEIDLCRVDPPGRAAVPAHLLRTLSTADLA
jgi:electron transfer flavoprotein alpha subunit